MKKKLLLTSMMVAMSTALFGCGDKQINTNKYVTLGDYKNFEVEVSYYDYTEEELQAYIDEDLEYYVSSYNLYEYEPTDKKVVAKDDIANIDYVGKKDGVAFEGGTAEGYDLEIGSGNFIDGFEDGLIGVKVGETVDLDLTFPEEYGNEELAGQDVVFTVTVNSIDERKMPEYDENFFLSFGIDGVSSYDEYITYQSTYIEKAKDEQNESALASAIWDVVSEKCTVTEVPQKLIDEKKAQIDAEVDEYATNYGVDRATMLSYMGYDEESFETEKQETAEREAKNDLICMALAEAEGIKVEKEDVDQFVEEKYDLYGYESADELKEAKSEEYLLSFVRKQIVMDALKKYATVKELETISMLSPEMPEED